MVNEKSKIIYSHEAFLDESQYTGDKKFRTITLITLERNLAKKNHNGLKSIVKNANISEYKWITPKDILHNILKITHLLKKYIKIIEIYSFTFASKFPDL